MTVHWLLLRGLVRERRHWLDFPEQLAARTGGRVLTLDLPGVGTERHRDAPWTIRETVEDLRRRFLAEAGDGHWRLFAPSLGGMIALHWAHEHPEDFAEVVVSNTSARNLAGPFERLRPEALRTVILGLFTLNRLSRERRILRLISNTPRGLAQAETFTALAQEAPIPPRVLFRQLFAATWATAPEKLRVPLLVLCSEGDRLCSSSVSKVLAARTGGRLAVHPDAGHDLPLDAPDWVLDRMIEGAEPWS